MELIIDAVYCFFVIITLFNIFGQQQLHKMLFYFLQVIPKVIIALFSLSSSDAKHGLIIQISHNIRQIRLAVY